MPSTEIPTDEPNISSPESSLSSNSSLQRLQQQLYQLAPPSRRIRLESVGSNESFERIDGIIPEYDDNPNNDEEYYPGQPYLFPVILPPRIEPTLDELLRNVSGRDDLHSVQSLKLKVIAENVSLYRISFYMPTLKSLNLEGSVLTSLRDLGCLIHLEFLNISSCGLSSLDGTTSVSNVSTLIADRNMIQLTGPVQNLFLLKKLSLVDNKITDLGGITFLGLCPMLEDVDLTGNPVTSNQLYRTTLRQNLQSLQVLDGMSFIAEDAARFALEEFNKKSDNSIQSSNASTLSDESFSDNNISLVSIESEYRPATTEGVCRITISGEHFEYSSNRRERPGTATGGADLQEQKIRKRISLTSGKPICGSIVRTIRERHRQEQKNVIKSAWDDSSSSSGSSSPAISLNLNFSKTLQKSFPNKLPQTDVDLEMSMAGSIMSSGSSSSIESSTNCQKMQNE